MRQIVPNVCKVHRATSELCMRTGSTREVAVQAAGVGCQVAAPPPPRDSFIQSSDVPSCFLRFENHSKCFLSSLLFVGLKNSINFFVGLRNHIKYFFLRLVGLKKYYVMILFGRFEIILSDFYLLQGRKITSSTF